MPTIALKILHNDEKTEIFLEAPPRRRLILDETWAVCPDFPGKSQKI
jgi:hypothetical protein